MMECKNCDQLLARIKELEERERRCPTMLEAEARALVRALQEIITILGMDADSSPAQIVAHIAAMTKADHLPAAAKKVDPDPWLGVWRAKRHTALDNITTKVAFLEPGTIIRVKGVKDGYVHIFFGQEDFEWHAISWLQENFEKVTEAE